MLSTMTAPQRSKANPEKPQEKSGPECPYCGKPSVLKRSSEDFYNGTNYGPLWVCEPCKAWVGCHPNSYTPLGRLANKELRLAKSEAHRWFDPLWKEAQRRERKKSAKRRKIGSARNRAYKWLADQLGIKSEDCHIGMFDVEQCRKVVEVCKPHVERLRIRR